MIKIILWVVSVAVVFLAAIRYIEHNSIFFPMKEMTITPRSAGLSYEDVYFRTDDGKLINGWFMPVKDADLTVILCHGNAGNISHRIEKAAILRDLGLNVFLFDYRGYGKSEGTPSEAGLYKDAEAAYRHVTAEMNIPPDNIILYGESIGSPVAIRLAARVKVRGLITEESFTSIKDMAAMAYPFMPPVIFSSRFDAAAGIRNVKCPKLIMHSVNDEIVPYRMGQELYAAAAPPKTFLKLTGGHNTAFIDAGNAYRKGIKDFVESLK